MGSILDSDMAKGIGQLLRENRIRVPYYQRSYAWKKSYVKELYDDLRRAIEEPKCKFYFLGTVVGCKATPDSDEIEIVDGQQRIATTAILLSAIRDYVAKLDSRAAIKFGFSANSVDPRCLTTTGGGSV